MPGSLTLSDIIAVDVANKSESLKVFYEDDRVIVLAFHDGFESLVELAQLVVFDRPLILILTCSWYVSEQRANIFRGILRKVIAAENASISYATFLMVANSEIEARHLETILGNISVVRANNSSFIDETFFSLGTAFKLYDAVLNAKVNRFKRHELSALIESKIFITYRNFETSDNATKDSNLMELQPRKIFWNLKPAEIAPILNQCRVGLMLSAEEGACYASLEYLLCGLPVVSTPSLGGRDEFYNDRTAVTVDATPTAVKIGVSLCVERLESNHFNSEEIRNTTLSKVFECRARLADAISQQFVINRIPPLQEDVVTSNIRKGSKFATSRNFWIKIISKREP